MQILSVVNQKGGVGKTTLVIQLAAYFSYSLRVLVIDCDSQGHVAQGFRQPKNNGLWRWIVNSNPLCDVLIPVNKNLALVANDQSALSIEEYLGRVPFKEYFLHNLLSKVKGFDIVLIDCPPGLTLTSYLALVGSTAIISPTTMDFLALDGIAHLLKTIATLSEIPHVTPPTILGVLPSIFETRTKESLINLAKLQEIVGPNLILPPVFRDPRVREASSRGQTIWDYAPKCRAAIGVESDSKITNSLGRFGGYLHTCEIVSNYLSEKGE